MSNCALRKGSLNYGPRAKCSLLDHYILPSDVRGDADGDSHVRRDSDRYFDVRGAFYGDSDVSRI